MNALQQDLLKILHSHSTCPPTLPTALIWPDGFVDEIYDVVDKRFSPQSYVPIKTITAFAERIKKSSGQSGNLEMVSKRVKYGGNAPILANALGRLQVPTILIGCLGGPGKSLHPVFSELESSVTQLISLTSPSYTDALEFTDGKIMLGKHASLHHLSWSSILQKIHKDQLLNLLHQANLFAQVNWVMIPQMNDIWDHLLTSLLPSTSKISPAKYTMFLDLSDPEKRTKEDLVTALTYITGFQQYYHVILGLNLREASQIAQAQGISVSKNMSPQLLASRIRSQLDIAEVVIHNAQFAVSAQQSNNTSQVQGISVPYIGNPELLTGAGDHFNAGYCYGVLNHLSSLQCLTLGISTATYYVQTGTTPTLEDVYRFISAWDPCLLSDS